MITTLENTRQFLGDLIKDYDDKEVINLINETKKIVNVAFFLVDELQEKNSKERV